MTQNGVHHGAPPTVQLIDGRPGELTVSSRRDGDVHTIALAGELDLATAERVEQELRRVEATDARSIVVDLSGLAFMDSTGIRILVGADARSRADSGRLVLRRGPAAVQRVVELTGLTDLLPFVD
jgi:anti-sigma B factor antagonist